MIDKPLANVVLGNVLNTTLVTRIEIEDCEGKHYYNFRENNKVIAVLSDNHQTLKITIKKHKK